MDIDDLTVAELIAVPKTVSLTRFDLRGTYWKARSTVQGVTGYDLNVEVSWNEMVSKASACLFVKHLRPGWARIYGIDMGDEHHNPTCDIVADPHRHNAWTMRYGCRMAASAPDLTGKSVLEMVAAFCEECHITNTGTLTLPVVQGRIF